MFYQLRISQPLPAMEEDRIVIQKQCLVFPLRSTFANLSFSVCATLSTKKKTQKFSIRTSGFCVEENFQNKKRIFWYLKV
jgi:hypothetical protein